MSKSSLDLVREEIASVNANADELIGKKGLVFIPNRVGIIKTFIVISLLLLGFIALNVYQYFNVKVYIVNGTAYNMTVKVDNKNEITIVPFYHGEMELPQGKHTYLVSGAINKEITKEIKLSWWDRFSGGYFYAINPGGQTILYKESTVYYPGEIPADAKNEWNYLFGEEIIEKGTFDYVFMEFPDTITVEGSTPIKKNRISTYNGTPDQAITVILANESTDKTLDFLEEYMQLYPKSILYGTYYASLVAQSESTQTRGESFMLNLIYNEKAFEPVYERTYQQILISMNKKDYLLTKYKEMMDADINNPDKIYLYARLIDDLDTEMKYYDNALEIDPGHELSSYAKGYIYSQKSDFKNAQKYFDIAFSGKQVDFGQSPYKFEAYEANGEWDKIITQIDDNPLYTSSNLDYVKQKAMYYIAMNDLVSARKILNEYLNYESDIATRTQMGVYLDTFFYAVSGDWDKIDPRITLKGDVYYSEEMDFEYKIMKKDYENARILVDGNPNLQLNSFYTLPLAIGFKMSNKDELSLKYYNMAVDSYKSDVITKSNDKVIVPLNKSFERFPDFGTNRSLFSLYFALNLPVNSSERKAYESNARVQNYHPGFPHDWIVSVLSGM
jgi:hypothetical protein